MRTFLSKINWEKYSKKHLGILFVIGILLVVISMPTSELDVDDEEVVENTSTPAGDTENSDYKTQMENQLTQILSNVDGVGDVEVMITLQSTTERVVEKDVYTEESSIEENTVYTDTSEGQEPYVIREEYPTIEGILVSASGGDNSIVIKNITEAVQALFDVDTHKIKVMKMKSN